MAEWVKDPVLSLQVTQVTAMAWIQFLAQKLLHAAGVTKEKKNSLPHPNFSHLMCTELHFRVKGSVLTFFPQS